VLSNDPFPELVTLLVSELATVFQHVQAAHPDEHFYGFGLISSGMFYYLIPACSSEESLRRAAERESAYDPKLTIEEHMARMRWRGDSWQEHFLRRTSPILTTCPGTNGTAETPTRTFMA